MGIIGRRRRDAGGPGADEARLRGIEDRLVDREVADRHTENRLRDAELALDAAQARARKADLVTATTALVEGLPPAPQLVSVIMPTRDRAALLPVAIASVLAQRHASWELVVVDDGSVDETPEILAELAGRDARIRVLRTEGVGASAARNRGLAETRGPLVAYLDDDNTMGPLWLRAVVWAFGRHPDAEVAYGARVIDAAAVGMPWVELGAWDRHRHQLRCMIDQNVLAHRAGLAEAHYDSRVEVGSDWDASVRLTQHRDPVEVPVVAVVYATAGAADRLSERPEALVDWVQVQRMALRRGPLRVLGLDMGMPPVHEAAARAQLERWERAGVRGAWCADARPVPADVRHWHGNLEEALRVHDPAVVAIHATSVAPAQLTRLVRAERPFLLQVPDGADRTGLAGAAEHPLCAGVWRPEEPGVAELLDALDVVRVRAMGISDPLGVLARARAVPLPLPRA